MIWKKFIQNTPHYVSLLQVWKEGEAWRRCNMQQTTKWSVQHIVKHSAFQSSVNCKIWYSTAFLQYIIKYSAVQRLCSILRSTLQNSVCAIQYKVHLNTMFVYYIINDHTIQCFVVPYNVECNTVRFQYRQYRAE